MTSRNPTDSGGPHDHPCPKGDGCALNKGAYHCFHCKRNWPPDETWDRLRNTNQERAERIVSEHGRELRRMLRGR